MVMKIIMKILKILGVLLLLFAIVSLSCKKQRK